MITENDFEVISNVEILHRADARGVRIGRVVQVKFIPTGEITITRYWYDYSSPDIRLSHIT